MLARKLPGAAADVTVHEVAAQCPSHPITDMVQFCVCVTPAFHRMESRVVVGAYPFRRLACNLASRALRCGIDWVSRHESSGTSYVRTALSPFHYPTRPSLCELRLSRTMMFVRTTAAESGAAPVKTPPKTVSGPAAVSGYSSRIKLVFRSRLTAKAGCRLEKIVLLFARGCF